MGPGSALAALAFMTGVGRRLGGASHSEVLAWAALGFGLATWGAAVGATLALDVATWDPEWGRSALRAAGWRPVGVALVGAGVLHGAHLLVDGPARSGSLVRGAAAASAALCAVAVFALIAGLIDIEAAAHGWVGRGLGSSVAMITLSAAMALGMATCAAAAGTVAWCVSRSEA